MNLKDAQSLLWLVPLAGVIIALYLLRMRRRDVQVPAVFLWPQKTEEVRANTLFQKLRFSWLLVLQLLALALIVTALARPQLLQKGLAGKVTVVVLDASASMGATDVTPSRLEEAKKLVAGMVSSLGRGDRLALIEAGPTPRVVFPLGNDPPRQARELSSVRQIDSESDMGEALRLAAAISGTTEGAKIVVLTDGGFERVEDFSASRASVTYQRMGVSGENLGIQALGTSDGPNGNLAYIGVKNFGTQPASSGVTVTVDGKVLDSAKFQIAPGQTWGKTVRVPPRTRLIEARLDKGDALKADDYAVALTDGGASARVLLVTNGDMFLERALSLDPRVTLDKANEVPNAEKAGSGGPGMYDIVVFDGVQEEAVKARGVLTLGAAGPSSPVKVTGTVKAPEFISSVDDPIVDGVDFENVYIEKGQRVSAKGAGRTVVESKNGPLVVVADTTKRQVYVSFSPLDSDFPLSVGFPLLIGNTLDFLIGKESTDLLSVRVGQPFAVSAADQSTATLVRDGDPDIVLKARAGRLVVREVTRAGKYQLRVGNKKQTIYASLRAGTESAIAPKANLELGSSTIASTGRLSRFEDFWKPLLIVVLLVLGIEWWAFARRS